MMEKQDSTTSKKEKSNSNRQTILLVIGLVLIIPPSLYFLIKHFFISGSDIEIDDSIVIFINFVGTILVLLSYIAQLKANKDQKDRFEQETLTNKINRNYDNIADLVDQLDKDCSNYIFNNSKGSNGIQKFIEDFQKSIVSVKGKMKRTPFKQLDSLYDRYLQILEMFENREMDQDLKKSQFSRINSIYSACLDSSCKKLIDVLNKSDLYPEKKSKYEKIIALNKQMKKQFLE